MVSTFRSETPKQHKQPFKKLLDSNLEQIGSAGRKHVEKDYTIQR
jgi:hypothetical protein